MPGLRLRARMPLVRRRADVPREREGAPLPLLPPQAAATGATAPSAKGERIRQVGLGTQRVEEEVRKAFPEARTLRWDRDVTRGRDSHEAILARFLAHEADVLIGTQMIAKGLDIPLVTLVGVITADIALHLPDFRAGERTFQLLEQVAGRAGRGPRGGRVVIQTYTPEHHAIQAVKGHDYEAMYQREVEFRRNLGYPPFGRLVRLTYAHTGAEYSQLQAAAMVRKLTEERDRRGLPNLDILGPAPAFVARVRGRWRWNVVLRGADPVALIREMQFPRGWTVDVEPASLVVGRPRSRLDALKFELSYDRTPHPPPPDPVLRHKAVRVPAIDASIHRLIEDMIESMYAANGVGLAAPQIGVSLRVVVIGMPEEEPFALINPEIVKRSGERTVDEGCLSLPGYRGELTRSSLVIAKALDPAGKQVRIHGKDNLLAQALEHEIDHINGTLYVDHLPSMDVLRRIDQQEEEERARGGGGTGAGGPLRVG